MIPFIRSLTELMVITKPKNEINENPYKNDLIRLDEDSGQAKRYIRSTERERIDLPHLPKMKRRKWKKGKEFVSKLFDELDYNNQILSSYELTLQERQSNFDQNDVA
tara:strand:+ start:209 stop:529 length:321 start_codon:yes stop_codon:yes gene_type:complete